MAFGKKLFMNLVVLHRMLRYRLPEGRRVNSLCAGWVWSLVILVALLWQRDGYSSRVKVFPPPPRCFQTVCRGPVALKCPRSFTHPGKPRSTAVWFIIN